ncbi:hypothetical protein ACWT_3845 [Actinoplanes sp. SE50]|uniref:SHOCT domain-containing protein n=1 Tax=unclassified Actinoplanes TaxID=2626549 RepID=UPI00023ECEA5|nr:MULTISPECIES: SHOCT domain-containing protein [unclassified Actinoplanes]AEV84869.1 hypothetical protein ACPL_3974 [Actinoplanes sp. SE50/110]ATO83260.1 hypothetical protein ACWT_3845 [Actinoplanes sp. SE50]SLM00667.1 hypothetical protein ACSP50_3900 [Actinoplanes sp. SE50/110]
MPGLLRGIARTAVIAGTATAVSNRVSRRQQGRWARHDAEDQYLAEQEQEPVDQEDPMTAKLDQLRRLADLKAEGLLTDAEVEVQKSRILHS